MIHAIPTKYQGVQFRSRLEAKWAAFFDLLNWRWEYEPFDRAGWIPDFVIFGARQHVLLEVKPTTFKDKLFDDTKGEIENALLPDEEAVIVSYFLPQAECSPEFECVGYLAERNCYIDGNGNEKLSIDWQRAPLVERDGSIGFCSEYGHYRDRVSGDYSGGTWGNVPAEISKRWRTAGNATQWHPPTR